MRKEEFTNIENFIIAGNGYGDRKVREIADKKWQASLNLLLARKTLQEQYRTDVRKAIFRVLKSGKYRDKYNGYVCHFLSEMIEDPGFDQDGTRFQAIVQAAAERAFAAVYDEVSEFLHALFDEIGSGLETTPH